jgi:hypothetical protein
VPDVPARLPSLGQPGQGKSGRGGGDGDSDLQTAVLAPWCVAACAASRRPPNDDGLAAAAAGARRLHRWLLVRVPPRLAWCPPVGAGLAQGASRCCPHTPRSQVIRRSQPSWQQRRAAVLQSLAPRLLQRPYKAYGERLVMQALEGQAWQAGGWRCRRRRWPAPAPATAWAAEAHPHCALAPGRGTTRVHTHPRTTRP